jgi:plasmid maintenance system antidote protein VapI
MTVGQALQRILDENEISQALLAYRTGLTTKHVNQVVKDHARLSAYVAVQMEGAFPVINAKHLLLHQLRIDLAAARAKLFEHALEQEQQAGHAEGVVPGERSDGGQRRRHQGHEDRGHE